MLSFVPSSIFFAINESPLLVLSIVAFLIWTLFQRSSNDNGNEQMTADRPALFEGQYLATLAWLCKMTYAVSKRGQDSNNEDAIYPTGKLSRVHPRPNGTTRVTVRRGSQSIHSDFEILQTWANDSIWLICPSIESTFKHKWIIAFRGTQVKHLTGVSCDLKLALSVGLGRDILIKDVIDMVFKEVLEKVVGEHSIGKDDSILLIGHSLGASLAEGVQMHLKEKQFSGVSSVCFDSPGLPDFIRNCFEVSTSDEQIQVYGNDNIVNNLCTAPRGAKSYRAGIGPPFRLDTLHSLLFGIPTHLKKIFIDSMASHNIENIASLLEEGHFQRDTFTARRNCSGMALWFLTHLGLQLCRTACNVNKIFGAPVAPMETPLFKKGHGGKRTPPTYESASRGEFPEFPGVEEAKNVFYRTRRQTKVPGTLPQPTPYKVTNIGLFTRQLDRNCDIVVPFVGLTSVGKSSILKAIFEIPPNEDLIEVRARKHVTSDRVVILWKVNESGENEYRYWLMDIPGVEGSANDSNRTDGEDRVSTQLYAMGLCVQATCFVVANNPTEESKRLFEEVVSVVNDRVFVVFNHHNTVRNSGDRKELLDEAVTEYRGILSKKLGKEVKPVPVILTKVYRCKGATQDDLDKEEGINCLRQELLSWMDSRREDIASSILREENEQRNEQISTGTVEHPFQAVEGDKVSPRKAGGMLVAGSLLAISAGVSVPAVVCRSAMVVGGRAARRSFRRVRNFARKNF